MPAKKLRQQFEPVNSHHANPLPERVFRFSDYISAKSVPSMQYINYRPPRIVKTKTRWYVEYYYRVPIELKEDYKNEWERFRVFEDINRYKTDDYANALLLAVKDQLEGGYNPFYHKQVHKAEKGEASPELITVKRGLELFLEKQNNKGLSDSMLRKYKQTCEVLNEWFIKKNLQGSPVGKIKRIHIEQLLDDTKKEKEWGNRQYNNIKGYCFTIFEFFSGRGWIEKNPVEKIDSLKTASKKYRYFDKNLFPKITGLIQNTDPYLWQACQFVYYLAVRSSMELRLLKVGDILEGGELFLFKADATKGKREDAIPVDPHLKEVMQQMGLFKANPKHFIFTASGKPGPKSTGINFFAKRFAKVRKAAGLGSEYSMYSFRHSRCIHLLKDGAKLADISKLFRHRDIAITAVYARELNADFDSTQLQQLTRKI